MEANPEDNSFRRSDNKVKESPKKGELHKKDNSPYLNPSQFHRNDPYLNSANPKKRSYQDYLTSYRRVSPNRSSSHYVLYPSP